MEKSKRYLMIWTPYRAVVDECRKRGMVDGDGSSFWDWMQPDVCELCEIYPSFTAAVAVARGKRSADIWHEPRVYEQHDRGYGWESSRFWEIRPGVTKADAIEVE